MPMWIFAGHDNALELLDEMINILIVKSVRNPFFSE